VPFPIVIGTERMDVRGIAGSTWTVARHQGNTTAAAHSTSDPVMSTPLPLLPIVAKPYTSAEQAQMCVVSVSGNSVTLIDIGDGWVNSNP